MSRLDKEIEEFLAEFGNYPDPDADDEDEEDDLPGGAGVREPNDPDSPEGGDGIALDFDPLKEPALV